jgi:uncharacterized protein (DUF486 family)
MEWIRVPLLLVGSQLLMTHAGHRRLTLNFVWAGLCLAAAAWFMFRDAGQPA